jgi:hypothetical protein
LGTDLIRRTTSKSASLIGALFFVLVFFSTESAAEALQPATFTAEIGVSALRFNYAEFKDDGNTWDKELGGVPGLSFRLGQRLYAWGGAWEWEGMASYHYGRVDYTGQTNLGVPYNTHTDETIGDFALRLGHWFGDRVMPYAGLGYRRWDRDIRPASIGGLFESYRWEYAWSGAKIIAHQQGASNLMLDIGWIKPLGPVMYVGAYNASLNPESKIGLRMMLTSHMALSENTTLILEPYFEYWRLGRSPPVTTGGITVYEPASKTKNLGVNIRLGRMF